MIKALAQAGIFGGAMYGTVYIGDLVSDANSTIVQFIALGIYIGGYAAGCIRSSYKLEM